MAIETIRDLEDELRDILDADVCVKLVDLAYSEDNLFANDIFFDADTFFDLLGNEEPKEVALKFFNGEDLDSRGSANPNRDYFRYNGADNVESTDDPGEIYLDFLVDDLVDYVIDHVDDRTFPDDIQELVDEYLDNDYEKGE